MFKRASIFLFFLFTTQTFWNASGLAQTPDSGIGSGRKIAAKKAELFHGAKKILVLQGFEIKNADEVTGVISTDVTPMRVNVSGCDCEIMKWQGEDRRPLIRVSVDVQVDDNRIAVHAHIVGDYPKEQISEKIIEDDLFGQISRYLQ